MNSKIVSSQSNITFINKWKTDRQKSDKPKGNIQAEESAAAEYIPTPREQKSTYSVDSKTIQRLKEESEKSYQQLRELVRRLLEKQGLTFDDLFKSDEDIPIDSETRLEAQAAIGEGGFLSPENVSDRIVSFAKAISGGDKAKIETLKAAIDKGFKEAAKALGGELPEISQKTYNLIMEKLDYWVSEE